MIIHFFNFNSDEEVTICGEKIKETINSPEIEKITCKKCLRMLSDKKLNKKKKNCVRNRHVMRH